MQPPPFHVLTGGPGSGKSSLIAALAKMGHAVSEECGRAIIRQQQAMGGQALPWLDPELFAERMQAWETRAYAASLALRRTVFFDRSLVDVIGYLRLSGLAVPHALMDEAKRLRYQRQVFLLPHWPEIYRTDAQRRQSPQEAKDTCAAMRDTYAELGYELVEVPRANLQQRRDFILQRCALSPAPWPGNVRE